MASLVKRQRERLAQRWGYRTVVVAIPMLGLTVLLFGLSVFMKGVAQDVLVELGATALGVLVTVFYIDAISRREEARRWAPAERSWRLQTLSLATETLRVLSYHDKNTDECFKELTPIAAAPGKIIGPDPWWLGYAEQYFIPSVPDIVKNLDEKGMGIVSTLMKGVSSQFDRIIASYKNIIEPEELVKMSNISMLAQVSANDIDDELVDRASIAIKKTLYDCLDLSITLGNTTYQRGDFASGLLENPCREERR